MLNGIRLYAHLARIITKAQEDIHRAHSRMELDEDQMEELTRHAGRRLDWAYSIIRNFSEDERIAYGKYLVSIMGK